MIARLPARQVRRGRGELLLQEAEHGDGAALADVDGFDGGGAARSSLGVVGCLVGDGGLRSGSRGRALGRIG